MSAIGIPLGDPAGIGTEVTVKAVARLLQEGALPEGIRLVLIGRRDRFDAACSGLGIELPLGRLRAARNGKLLPAVSFLDQTIPGIGEVPAAAATAEGGKLAYLWLSTAIDLAMKKQVRAIVTAPVNKHALHKAGYDYPGQTEILQQLSGAHRAVMMLAGGTLRVALATTHRSLRSVPDALTTEGIAETVRVTARDLTEKFGITSPRLAVCGLNPHAGESGDFGTEDRDVVAPAVADCIREGIRATGPLPADTLFPKAARGEYDAVIAMYHDQGMIPVKLAAFGRGVNVTLGLPFVRTSPDHGTAYDIAGKGIADAGSMEEAIRLAIRLVSPGAPPDASPGSAPA